MPLSNFQDFLSPFVLHGFGVFDRDFHQVFSPENIPFENFTHLPDHFLPDPWNVHLFGDVGERKVSNSGIPGSLRRLQMPGCAASPLRSRLSPGKLMPHVDRGFHADRRLFHGGGGGAGVAL